MTCVGAHFSFTPEQVGCMTISEAVAYLEAFNESLKEGGGSSFPDKNIARRMHMKAKAKGYNV